jgi:nucleoside 2-deoxyribosyltransferase
MKQKAYLICPVRNTFTYYKNIIDDQVKFLEQTYDVYYPARDTNQNQQEISICDANLKAIQEADVVFIIWDGISQGCLFDAGMAFALGKPLRVITGYMPRMTRDKSFQNLFYAWEESEE